MQLTKNTNRPWKTTWLTGLLTLLCAGAALAQQMNYQGRLTDPSGNAVPDAQYAITFDIYDSATDGIRQWGPQVIPADTVQGRFNVILGPTDTASRNIVNAFNGGNKYLQITFQGTPILPRQQILSSPTAFFAQQAGQLASVFVLNGNVGIGKTNPATALDVVGSATISSNATVLGKATFSSKVGIGTPNPGALLDIRNNSGPNELLRLSGSAYDVSGGTSTQGISLFLGLNRDDLVRTDLMIGNSRKLAATDSVIRIIPGEGNVSYIDSVTRSGGSFKDLALQGTAMIIKADGKVGIGTGAATPSGKLDVAGGVYLGGAGTGSRFSISGDQIQQLLNGVAAPMFLNVGGGRVNIGTNPGGDRAKLVVNGSASYNLGGFSDYFTLFGNLQERRDTGNLNVSVWGSGIIAGLAIHAFSDERIKSVEGPSDASRDLHTLLGIEVTDFSYIDTLAKGTGQHKKVVAQQVEKVFPQAVSKSTDVVPDIYQKAEIKDGWVQLTTNLKQGERVRLIGEKQEGIHEVLEVAAGRFRTDFMVEDDKVFVFGREVKDFRSVDYEAISMLNVSATQELARRLEKLEARETHLADLEQKAGRMATLEKEIAGLKKMVALLAKAGKDTEQAAQSTTPPRPAAAAPVWKPITTASLER